MANDLDTWELLFRRALEIVDAAREQALPVDEWTFGGGTVLMRRHRHRFSKDVDIFVNDPQYLGFLSPRLSPAAGNLTGDYIEADGYVKLLFAEGEIDFIASPPLTDTPSDIEELFGHQIQVERSSEIIAKKIWHRGADFTARDIFDFAMVAELEPNALIGIDKHLRDRRAVVLDRIASHHEALKEAFEQLQVLEYRRTFDECVLVTSRVLEQFK